jgi:ABC-type multidrug transport system fused ATPase/permease subunit/GT2 family glycosyltransferase
MLRSGVTTSPVSSPVSFLSDLKARSRPEVRGKFLFIGRDKFYPRGVTYGTFRPAQDGQPFRDPESTEFDLAQMAAHGINSVRTYTVPPRWFLDLAEEYGLHIMVGIPWEQHIAFLDDGKRARDIETRVRAGVKACAGHPAVLAYAIGNEISGSIARWYGHRRIEQYLQRLYSAAKSEDSGALVTYVNYPTTEYLDLPFLDLVCFNVYLEKPDTLKTYLARLQNLAGDRPLILTELGVDSKSKGPFAQAEMLDWQIRSAFASGCAGAFVYAWTDEWHTGDTDILDWDFGLVDRNREPKPALAAVCKGFAELPLSTGLPWPRVSVVVCVHNGASTIRECLEALRHLDYPDYEVLVVDDGSTDATSSLAAEYDVRLFKTDNRGLGAARNLGIEAATGEIVAFVDGDAYPDPQWLRYLAHSFVTTDYVGVGGPNLSPVGDSLVAECVDRSPGNPVTVLLTDQEAEHIPGCNMAYRKASLQAIGCFDPRFRVAGDDVDICWRLRERGWTLGYNPAAFVWHHRRSTLFAYWKQQKGYGKAEALLERKWPEKYNATGNVTWSGRVYGKGLTRALQWNASRIYHGTWGSAAFQAVYVRNIGHVESLPMTPEWYIVVAGFAGLSLLGLDWAPLLLAFPLFLLSSGLLIVQAWANAARECSRFHAGSVLTRAFRFALTMFLHLEHPLARLWGRRVEGIPEERERKFLFPWRRRKVVWTEQWASAETRISALIPELRRAGIAVLSGSAFDRWDLELRAGFLGGARLALVVEEHGSGKQLARFHFWPVPSLRGLFLIGSLLVLAAGAAAGAAWLAAGLLAVGALWVSVAAFRECATGMGVIAHAVSRVTARSPVAKIESPKSASVALRAFRYLLPHARLAIVSLALMVLLTVAGLLSPWPMTLLLDSVFAGHPLPGPLEALLGSIAADRVDLLIVIIFADLALKFAVGGMQLLDNYVRAKLNLEIELDFRGDLFQHAQRLSLSFHEGQRSGRLVYTLTTLTGAAPGLILELIPVGQSVLTLCGMFWITLQIDAQLALLSLCVVPSIFYSIGYYSTHIQERLRQVKELEGESVSIMQEALAMLHVVIAFGREDHELARFRQQGQQAVDARVDVTLRQTLFSTVVNATTVLGTAAVLGLGAYHTLQGQITAGRLLLVLSYIASVYSPLETISGTLGSVQDQLVGLRMTFGLLDTEPETQERPGVARIGSARGAVRFEHVSFNYLGRSGTLKDVSFDAAPGEVIALVGPTGAGKTTLMSLIPRFYDPLQGRIFLDDQDLRTFSLKSLRNQISIVLQEPLLFSGTVADNIRYGRLDASFHEIVQAAQAANADEFIRRLPQGYDTRVGERGAKLSGGERQRLAVARAFLKKAPLLLLDEPTSSIDSKTEAVILEALDRLMQGRTTFITAHRLSTIRHADRILVLNRGELVDQGSHEQLLARPGLYRQLYNLQSQPHLRHLATGPRRDIRQNGHNGHDPARAATESALVWQPSAGQDYLEPEGRVI